MVPDGFALAGTSWSIPVGRAVAPVWDVQRTSGGGIHPTKKLAYVNPLLLPHHGVLYHAGSNAALVGHSYGAIVALNNHCCGCFRD